MLSEPNRLEQGILNIEKELCNLPDGRLICAKNGNSYKWYHTDGHKKVYIPKKNRQLAERLAIKTYLSLMREDLENELFAINSYLQQHSTISKAEQLLTSPEYQRLLISYLTPKSLDLVNWINASYERNMIHPEKCVHQSVSGNRLRSKSEALIDTFLFLKRIPFRYECALQLGDITLYPDFTICHPVTKEIYYWEHFGLMDSVTYSKNMCSKLQLYISHNIVPSIQLITTFETREHPLSPKIVENIIEQYFL